MSEDIKKLRDAIDRIDDELAAALNKRAIAYLALATMGHAASAQKLVGNSFRDRAVLRIVRACAQLQETLTERLP